MISAGLAQLEAIYNISPLYNDVFCLHQEFNTKAAIRIIQICRKKAITVYKLDVLKSIAVTISFCLCFDMCKLAKLISMF